jgi:hypothetical protein
MNLMKEINVLFLLYLSQSKFVIKVYENNQSCIAMANNHKFSPWTKHIAIKYQHFRKHGTTQSNPNGFILIVYCSTNDQIADIFTKPVQDDIFFGLQNLLLNWWLGHLIMRECDNIVDLYVLACSKHGIKIPTGVPSLVQFNLIIIL